MVSHTGSTRVALFLLCCMGSLMFSHMAPTNQPQPEDIGAIITELWNSSKKLLEDYQKKETGVPESTDYSLRIQTLLPCFTSDSQPPSNINSSTFLPYFKAIKPLLNNSEVQEIIEQLDKLKLQNASETEVSVPTDTFECKRFILTILRQFSECLERVKSLNSGAE
ncbi:interleukin-31 [Diceros bicornis minor]|uniref:Interleukin-31 n=1 Tax=Diceros bicornis minor TaxID=77932 RepID=A0A7J7FMP3_DICBM|nr:interleukin-31 [Diceros bicornis minor]KAF5929333.1 hypothetical protein HPG69_019354 [Diceros bicornis minor]